MQITVLSLAGGFAMLLTGMAIFIAADRLFYPAARATHEEKKLTGEHLTDPRIAFGVLKYFCLAGLPALGLVFGDPVLSWFAR